MNNENIEFALNQIIETSQKCINSDEYIIKAIESLAENLQDSLKTIQQINKPNTNVTFDTKQLEQTVSAKFSEVVGALKSHTKEVHYSKSYFLYPEGQGGKALLYFAIKYMSIVVASIIFLFAVRFVSLKIEDNSNIVKHSIALQYIFANTSSGSREFIERIMNDLSNDSIKDEYLKTINKYPLKLK